MLQEAKHQFYEEFCILLKSWKRIWYCDKQIYKALGVKNTKNATWWPSWFQLDSSNETISDCYSFWYPRKPSLGFPLKILQGQPYWPTSFHEVSPRDNFAKFQGFTRAETDEYIKLSQITHPSQRFVVEKIGQNSLDPQKNGHDGSKLTGKSSSVQAVSTWE